MTTLLTGDALTVLKTLPAQSVHCVVTSPPYWGLRDYGTAKWKGGDSKCDHAGRRNYEAGGKQDRSAGTSRDGGNCRKCGARRVDQQLGLERTPEEYVAHQVEVFREIHRVLRDDGTAWLNLGDSYATGGGPHGGSGKQRHTGLKPKDLIGIPWRVAFALQADGWYLRSDIIWHKPNPMPESITDRPTKGHEYIFLLAKSRTYFYDHVAVAEPCAAEFRNGRSRPETSGSKLYRSNPEYRYRANLHNMPGKRTGRRRRTVWTVTSAPYKGHFATFPPKLIEPCILAGTSERGVCAVCGAPWVRVLAATIKRGRLPASGKSGSLPAQGSARRMLESVMGARAAGLPHDSPSESAATTGWRASCACNGETVPATVLDPFAGAGTTLLVAQRFGRGAIGIDLNPGYVKMARRRLAEPAKLTRKAAA